VWGRGLQVADSCQLSYLVSFFPPIAQAGLAAFFGGGFFLLPVLWCFSGRAAVLLRQAHGSVAASVGWLARGRHGCGGLCVCSVVYKKGIIRRDFTPSFRGARVERERARER